jgi:hypothetical protein
MHTPYGRAATAALFSLSALAAPALAQTHQLTANLLANAFMTLPLPGVTDSHTFNLNLLNEPGTAQLQVLSQSAGTPNGGQAQARFEGRVGLLRAYAEASYPYCCTPQGNTVTTGYTHATAQGTFFDTVAVFGAGLAPGTPVSYRVDFDISGGISSPFFEVGGHLSAFGVAEVRLTDLTANTQLIWSWDASRDPTGRYSLTLPTFVGHNLGINGMLYAGAYVDAYAITGRSAVADFEHSAVYTLVPSVAGLNTLGASGHDFLAPVPEPATWLSLLGGLVLLGVRWGAGRIAERLPRAPDLQVLRPRPAP